jgi:myo-inositol-1(or 4)-monophosphatase
MRGGEPKPKELLATALEAARTGAQVLSRGYGRAMTIDRKGPDDPVTNFDMRAEVVVRAVLAMRHPDHAVLAEEGGIVRDEDARYRWHVDPLDGTVNFTRGRPEFAVSVACSLMDPPNPPKVLVGVVLAPILRELWWAVAGGGARLDHELPGRRIRRRLSASTLSNPAEALALAGFPYGYRERADEVLVVFDRVARAAGSVRQSGSAALDLCSVASGRADAYFESDLKPWDVAAGSLIATEAGASVTDWSGRPYVLEASETLLAAAPGVREALLAALAGKEKTPAGPGS